MSNQIDIFGGYPQPKTNIQEVLLTLITNGKTSFFDFSYMQGYRTRVSNLVLCGGLKLETQSKTKVNKFGNTYTYHVHILPDTEKEKAIALYNKMVKNE